MWARISELILGGWLLISRFIFSTQEPESDLAAGLAIVLFAALSFITPLNKMHLLQLLPAGWLLYVGYSYPTPILPFGLQNDLITALLLLLFLVIPSHASDHPHSWVKFLEKKE